MTNPHDDFSDPALRAEMSGARLPQATAKIQFRQMRALEAIAIALSAMVVRLSMSAASESEDFVASTPKDESAEALASIAGTLSEIKTLLLEQDRRALLPVNTPGGRNEAAIAAVREFRTTGKPPATDAAPVPATKVLPTKPGIAHEGD